MNGLDRNWVSSHCVTRATLVFGIAFASAIAPAQGAQQSDLKAFLQVLSKIRTKAEAGVVVTYRREDDSGIHRSIARYSIMGRNQRLDEVVFKLQGGKEIALFASTHTQRDQKDGSKIVESGTYQNVEGLPALQVLESLNTDSQPRIMRNGGIKDILFSHLAWRYGRASDGWISELILGGKNVEVTKTGQNYRIGFDRGAGVRSYITVEDSANPRIVKRSGRPNSESNTALLGFDLYETGYKTMAFTRTSDYSKFPEHVLQREDTPDHKIPRGRDEGRTDYTILSEKFSPLAESYFDLKLIAKNGSSARRQKAIAYSQIGAEGEGQSASQVSTMLWVRRGFIILGFIVAGIYYLRNYLSRQRKPKE